MLYLNNDDVSADVDDIDTILQVDM